MHPDSGFKYKERLEHDIKGKMALVFGSDVEAYRFKDYSLEGRYYHPVPVYGFHFFLKPYQQHIQIQVVGTAFGIVWGQEALDALSNISSNINTRSPLKSYSPEKLQEILEEVRTYLDQGLSYTDLIFSDPLTLDSWDVKIWEIQRLIREVFQDQISFSQKDYDVENDQLRRKSLKKSS